MSCEVTISWAKTFVNNFLMFFVNFFMIIGVDQTLVPPLLQHLITDAVIAFVMSSGDGIANIFLKIPVDLL